MSSLILKHKTAVLENKNNTYHGIVLLLSAFLLISRSAGCASAQSLQAHSTSIKQLQADSPATFGTKGQKHWYIQGAAATTLDNEESDPRRFALVGAGISKFLFNGHSINLELNTIYFNQPDNNALGLNLALLMRWHFIRQPNWSLYVDGGAGVLGTTSDVPSKGASFNFTPQAGGGVSFKLKHERRLMLGLRWHHISHADLFEANPGRDSIMGYVGLEFPR